MRAPMRAIRYGSWKIYRRNGSSEWDLYDLSTDIGETSNRAAANPNVVQELESSFTTWMTAARDDQ